MKRSRIVLQILLSAGFLAACSSGTATPSPGNVMPVEPSIGVTTAASPTEDLPPPVDDTTTPAVDIQPIATSRGPELHATDPATVSLGSGQLQLVEFFRFT